MSAEGRTLGRYRLHESLGRGGMGEVFKAWDPRLQRYVALKVLHPTEDEAAAARLLREARAAAAISHPNVVFILDVGEAEATPFIAMELVSGASLRSRMADASLSMERKLAILRDVAAALEAAHRRGLIHRDVKPENIMVAEDGAVKVLDFGIARRTERLSAPPSSRSERAIGMSVGSHLSLRTEEGVIVGTPRYSSPEQLGATSSTRAAISSRGASSPTSCFRASTLGERRTTRPSSPT